MISPQRVPGSLVYRIDDTISVSDLVKKVAGHQGLQLQKVVGPDEKL